MYQTTTLIPHAEGVDGVRAQRSASSRGGNIYALHLSDTNTIQSSDPRVARDYFAAIAKAAQQLVDAADQAIVAEPLDLPTAVSA